MSQDPPPQRFHTIDGLPPNGGVPFNRTFVTPPAASPQAVTRPQTMCQHSSPQRFYTANGRPPDEDGPLNQSSTESLLAALLGRLQLRQQLPTRAAVRTQPQAPTDPLGILQKDVLYLFPEKHTNIRFLYNGQRPCDHRGLWTSRFDYQCVKLPINMTVGEMVRRIGYPGRGLQEMVELIEPVSAALSPLWCSFAVISGTLRVTFPRTLGPHLRLAYCYLLNGNVTPMRVTREYMLSLKSCSYKQGRSSDTDGF